MRLLLIHSDYIEYEAKQSTSVAEEVDEKSKSGRVEETLTAFIAVESVDEKDPKASSKKASEEIKQVTNQIGTNRVVLYPYAHLSSDLASPKIAVLILKQIEAILGRELEVTRAPFGWYKSFKISCKGHPLSELSRFIGADTREEVVTKETVSKALDAEEKAVSHLYVMTPTGELIDPHDFDFSKEDNLSKFMDCEVSKSRAVDKVPPHVPLMKRLEIADYEPGSDPGNMRYYPKGRLIKSLLETYVSNMMQNYGAMEVETPLMYDAKHPTLEKYLDRFPARQYSIESDKKELFLRFAACFGQFLMNSDMTISYKNLPLKMFEMTRYSFRREQRGELAGLRRLRSFTMPDMHTLCSDTNQAVSEFKMQYELCINVLNEIGIDLRDYEVGIRFTKDFYEQNTEFIKELVKLIDKPVLIEMWDRRFFYFVLKFEFNFIDALGKASALSTVQIDVENADRYGIKYTDPKNEEKKPVILHCSPSGAIERCIYALLEKAYMCDVPMLPVWLSPAQVRIIPIADRHIEFAEKISDELLYRVDIDDRDETIGKKIREASKQWIPYIAVVGDEEVENGFLTVTIRSESKPKKPKKVKMSVSELNDRIKGDMEEMPYRPLPLPKKLTLRPKFV